jgi:DNA-binding transcriptional ArsR family regulator
MLKSADHAAGLLGALANEKRLLILCHLLRGELSVGEIARKVRMEQSALSHQLAILRELGIVESRREHKRICYRLASREAREIIETLDKIYCHPQSSGRVDKEKA